MYMDIHVHVPVTLNTNKDLKEQECQNHVKNAQRQVNEKYKK